MDGLKAQHKTFKGEILVDHDTLLKREQRKEPFQIYKDIQKGHDEKT